MALNSSYELRGLQDIAASAGPQRPTNLLRSVASRQRDDPDLGKLAENAPRGIDAAERRQDQVHDDDIRPQPMSGEHGILSAGDGSDDRYAVDLSQKHRQSVANDAVIVHHDNSQRDSRRSAGYGSVLFHASSMRAHTPLELSTGAPYDRCG